VDIHLNGPMRTCVDDIGFSDGRTDLAADHVVPLGHPELKAPALREHALKLSEHGRLFFTKVVLAQPLHLTADIAHVAEVHDTSEAHGLAVFRNVVTLTMQARWLGSASVSVEFLPSQHRIGQTCCRDMLGFSWPHAGACVQGRHVAGTCWVFLGRTQAHAKHRQLVASSDCGRILEVAQ
jgi:hypothetical protein